MRALRFFGGFHGGNARAWLLTIVRNACYDWLRRNRPAEAHDELDEEVHARFRAEPDRRGPPGRAGGSRPPATSSRGVAARVSRGADPPGIRGTVLQGDRRGGRGEDGNRDVATRPRERRVAAAADRRGREEVSGVTCDDFRRFVDAHLDGELDLVRQAEMDEHLGSCAACSRLAAARRSLGTALRSEELYFRAPARLEQKVRAAARQSRSAAPRDSLAHRRRAGSRGGARRRDVPLAARVGPLLERSHRAGRRLRARALADARPSDRRAVVRAAHGPAVVRRQAGLRAARRGSRGGRIRRSSAAGSTTSAGKRVAALVYRRGAHLINLFAWPAPAPARETAESESTRDGYNIVRWTRGGTEFWAISDANAAELRQFAALVRARVP